MTTIDHKAHQIDRAGFSTARAFERLLAQDPGRGGPLQSLAKRLGAENY